MACPTEHEVAVSSHDQSRNSHQLIEKLYDVLEIPLFKRQRHYAEVSHLINQMRPDSVVSSQSSSSAGIRSNRSTQISIASSRTSYSSNSSTSGFQNSSFPPTLEESDPSPLPALVNVQNVASFDTTPRRLHKRFNSTITSKQRLQKRFHTHAASEQEDLPSNDAAVLTTPENDDNAAKTTLRRPCPFCDKTCGKHHDMKRHAKAYCCGRIFYVCLNSACRHSTGQIQLARDHRDYSGNFSCKQSGWTKIELQSKRKHFGCRYCQSYFDDLDTYLDHLGQSCRPDRVRGKGHQSFQIRALLQQPELKTHVESLCLELRGVSDASLGLYWTWPSCKMSNIIEQLEYGPKRRVDELNPGIAWDKVETFLRDLIQPSTGSVWWADLYQDLLLHQRAQGLKDKPLPALPQSSEIENTNQTGDFTGSFEPIDIHDLVDNYAFTEECKPEASATTMSHKDWQNNQLSCKYYGTPMNEGDGIEPGIFGGKLSSGHPENSTTKASIERFDHDQYFWDSMTINDDELIPHEPMNLHHGFGDDFADDGGDDFMQGLISVADASSSDYAGLGLPHMS